MEKADLAIVGGGLAGGLSVLALRHYRPDLTIRLIENGETIGGNHLWSFFRSDVTDEGWALVEPLVSHRWEAYDVAFPKHRRTLKVAYNTIASERLDAAVRAVLPASAIMRAEATAISPGAIRLSDGRTVEARAVIDARGGSGEGLELGWQKFCGVQLSIPQGHGLSRPVIMDATVEQKDGYRFVYCLPFSPTELFVEDTYYSDTPDLDADRLQDRIADYAAVHGWQIAGRSREERGVLPVVMGGDFDTFWPAQDNVARAGARGGFLHPLTSYSLPDAVRFALWLAKEAPLDDGLGAATRRRAQKQWRRSRYYRLLSAMLFKAAEPGRRYEVLQRFYRLSGPLIGRFYAGNSTLSDKLRILSGRPPVPLGKALKVLKDSL